MTGDDPAGEARRPLVYERQAMHLSTEVIGQTKRFLLDLHQDGALRVSFSAFVEAALRELLGHPDVRAILVRHGASIRRVLARNGPPERRCRRTNGAPLC